MFAWKEWENGKCKEKEKKKKRRKASVRLATAVEKQQVNKAGRNIFVQDGIIKWTKNKYRTARKLDGTNSLKQQLKLLLLMEIFNHLPEKVILRYIEVSPEEMKKSHG